MADELLNVQSNATAAIQELNRWRRALGLTAQDVATLVKAVADNNDQSVKAIRAIEELSKKQITGKTAARGLAQEVLNATASLASFNGQTDSRIVRLSEMAQQVLAAKSGEVQLAAQLQRTVKAQAQATLTVEEHIENLKRLAAQAKTTSSALGAIDANFTKRDTLRARAATRDLRGKIGFGTFGGPDTGDAALLNPRQRGTMQVLLSNLPRIQLEAGVARARMLDLFDAIQGGRQFTQQAGENVLVQQLQRIADLTNQARDAQTRAQVVRKKELDAERERLNKAQAADAAQLKTARQLAALRATAGRTIGLTPAGASAGGATDSEIRNVRKANEAVAQAALKAGLSTAQLRKEADLFLKGLGGGTPAVQAAYASVAREVEKLGATSRKFYTQEAKDSAKAQATLNKEIEKRNQLNTVNQRRALAQQITGGAQLRGGGTIFEQAALASARRGLEELVTAGKASGIAVARALDEARKGMSDFTGLTKQAVTAVRALVKAEQDVGKTAQAAMDKANLALRRKNALLAETDSKIKGILISWQSLGRILLVQVVHTAFGELTRALSEANRTLVDFQIKVSQARQISQDAPLSFNQWTESLRELAIEFGKPGPEVAAAAYEILSLQVTKGAGALQFLRSALILSETGLATAADSAKLLAATINSFSLTADQAPRVLDRLFKAVDLGAFKIQDLTTSFGRLGPTFAQAGASLDETLGALAFTTRAGVDASEAITFLTNVMTKLVNPGEDMQAFLADIGVNSGRAAIETFGFVGVLQKLFEATEGGKLEEIARLFREIRATRGGNILINLGIRGGQLQKDIDEIGNAGADSARAFEIAFESAGKNLQVQFNALRENIQASFSTPLVEKFSQLLGRDKNGLTNVVTSLTKLASGLAIVWALNKARLLAMGITGISSLSRLQAAATSARFSAVVLSRTLLTVVGTLKALGTGAVALGIGFLIEKFVAAQLAGEALSSRLEEISDQVRELQREGATSTLSDTITSVNERLSKDLVAVFQQIGQLQAAANRAAKDLGKNLQKMFDETSAGFRNASNAVNNAATRSLNAARQLLSEIERQIDGADSKIKEFQRDFAGDEFELRFDLLQDPEAQLAALRKQLADLRNQTVPGLGEDGEIGIKAAKEQEEIFKAQEENLKRQAKLITDIANSEEASNAERQAGIAAVENLIAKLRQLKDARVEFESGEAKRLADSLDAQQRSAEDRELAGARVKDILAKLNDTKKPVTQAEFEDLFGQLFETDLLNAAGVSQRYAEALEKEANARKAIIDQIAEQTAQQEKQKKLETELFDLRRQLQDAQEKAGKAEVETVERIGGTKGLGETVKTFLDLLGEIERQTFVDFGGGDKEKVVATITELLGQIDRGENLDIAILNLTTILSNLKGLFAQVPEVLKKVEAGVPGTGVLPPNIKVTDKGIIVQSPEDIAAGKRPQLPIEQQIQAFIDVLAKAQAAQEDRATQLAVITDLQKQLKAFQEGPGKGLVEQADKLEAIRRATESGAASQQALVAELQRANLLLLSIKQQLPQAPGKQFGGIVGSRISGKGFQDSLLTRLTPGEAVLTRKTVEGLRRPTFATVRNNPTSTSVTVGDISVNVPAGTSEQSALAVARAIKREMRKGTITLGA